MAKRVLLTTEGTYPYYSGGVSTWCHELISNLGEFDFDIVSIIDSPTVYLKYNKLDNIKNIISIPLWGINELSELKTDSKFSQIYIDKKNTTTNIIKEKFIALFDELLGAILDKSTDYDKILENLLNIYMYFKTYDYKLTMKSTLIYECFIDKLLEKNIDSAIDDVSQSLSLLYRFLNILSFDIPKSEITHSTCSGFCGIINILSKKLYGTKYVLTEHGVYIREQYLASNRSGYSGFFKNFYLGLIELIVKLNYHFADIICPVCEFNVRWETRLGVDKDKINVIYNGVKSEVFMPGHEKVTNHIICVARIDPLKDIENFIRACSVISKEKPDITFGVYGSATDENYFKRCIKLRDELGLRDKLKFYGYIRNVSEVYHKGDIIVMSSISEGFPYSVIEAMMSRKPVVATDVGGVYEALGGCGEVVFANDSNRLAKACIELLDDPNLRKRYAKRAYHKARRLYTTEIFINKYIEVYNKLS